MSIVAHLSITAAPRTIYCMAEDKELTLARKHIDAADKKIIDALEERMDVVVREIKPLKEAGEEYDEKRAEEVLDTRVSMGSKLSSVFVRELFKLIIQESVRLQKK